MELRIRVYVCLPRRLRSVVSHAEEWLATPLVGRLPRKESIPSGHYYGPQYTQTGVAPGEVPGAPSHRHRLYAGGDVSVRS